MHTPLFTIITITYNSSKWIAQAIESILATDFDNFELIIGDDASTDSTWEIINKYQSAKIVTYKNESNLGEYPNRNKALSLAKGSYFLFIDGDDILYKGTLKRIEKYIEYFPEAAAFWGVPAMDIVVFPFQLDPVQITKLNFFSTYPLAFVGFAETIFKVDAVRKVGGFSTKYAIGDTYIKKRLACSFPIVLTSLGYSFWRQADNQANKKVLLNFKNHVQSYQINSFIVNSNFFPLDEEDRKIASQNIKTSAIKLFMKRTLKKGNIIGYYKLLQQTDLTVWDSFRVFKTIQLNYYLDTDNNHPLMSKYNFEPHN